MKVEVGDIVCHNPPTMRCAWWIILDEYAGRSVEPLALYLDEFGRMAIADGLELEGLDKIESLY